MKRLIRFTQFFALLLILKTAALAAVSVSISPPSGEVQPGGQLQFTATASGTSNNVVIWSLSGAGCSGISCGQISSLGVYTAPASAPSYPIVAVTATSLADLTKSATASVYVGEALNVSVTVSPSSTGVRVTEQQLFVANVSGTNNTAVTWTIAGQGCSQASCGIITSTGLYTAPASIPSPAQVTITATSVANPLRSGKAVVTIQPPIIVKVSPSTARVVIGHQQQFTASVLNTGDTSVGWTLSGNGCSGAGCGSISASGLYTAPASVPSPPQVTVTATSDADPAKSASAIVTLVLPVAVSISPISASVRAEKTQQFTATVKNALNDAVTWTVTGSGCSGTACGTVSSGGLYTAPASVPSPALVSVTATSVEDPTKFASAAVTILPPIVVHIAPTTARVVTGEQEQFTATVLNTNNTSVTWTLSGSGCSGSSCGTLTSSGLYTAPGSVPSPPEVIVTATSVADPTKSASATVDVVPPVSVSLSPTNVSVIAGKTQQFTATVKNALNDAVTWTLSGSGCSGSTCGTISSTGFYTAPQGLPTPPLVVVTATSVADPTKSASANVTVLSPVAVTISPTSAQVAITKTLQFTATVTGTSNHGVTWTLSGSGCSGTGCGTISGNGLYTAPGTVPSPPQVTVTATSTANSSKSAQAVITVTPPIVVHISPTAVQVTTNHTQQFTATVTGSANTAVSWKLSGTGCSGATCGSITSTGLFTAPPNVPSPAVVVVTATASADPTASASANVTVVPPIVVKVSPLAVQVVKGKTEQFTATVTGSSNTGVKWSLSGAGCSGSTCGTISVSGLYTAPAIVPIPAQVRVTATSVVNSNASASATVTVVEPILVSVSPSSAVVALGQSQPFTATVTGTANTVVAWSVSGSGCSGAACGTITSQGVYTAPAVMPSPAEVTVKATSAANGSAFGTAQVTIAPGIDVSVAPKTSLVPINTEQQFTATVTGTLNTSVTWSVGGSGCNGSACGTITSSGLYTAPDTIPTPAQVTVTARSTVDSSRVGKAVVTISLPVSVKLTPANALVPLNAQEQFRVTVSGLTDTAVVWSVSGPGCSGAECGSINSAGLYTAPASLPSPTTVMITATSKANPAQSGSATVALLETNNAKLSGHYAFLFKGFNAAGVYQVAGTFVADGGGKLTTGLEDVNNTTTPSTALPLTGTYSLDGSGRGNLTLSNSLGSFTYRITLDVLGNKGTFVEFDSSGIRGTGVIERQDTSAFAASKITGSYAFSLTGADSSAGRIVAIGAILPKSGVILAGNLDVNDAGEVPSTFASVNGNLSVDSSGRGGLNLSIPGFDGGFFKFAIYVVSTNEFFLLSIDPRSADNPVFGGTAELQSGFPFSSASFAGSTVFSMAGNDGAKSQAIAGALRFDGISGVTTNFAEVTGGTAIPNTALSGAYDMQLNGRGILNLDNNNGSSTTWYLYAISSNQAFLMDASTAFVGSGEVNPQSALSPFQNSDVIGTYLVSSGETVSAASALASGAANFDGGNVKGNGKLAGSEDLSQGPDNNSTENLAGTYTISTTTRDGSGGITLTSPDNSSFKIWITSSSSAVGLNLTGNGSEPDLFHFDQ